jgi:hypothetical protein
MSAAISERVGLRYAIAALEPPDSATLPAEYS